LALATLAPQEVEVDPTAPTHLALATAMSTVIQQLVRSRKTHQHHHHTHLIIHSVAQNICAPFVGTEPVGNIMACTAVKDARVFSRELYARTCHMHAERIRTV